MAGTARLALAVLAAAFAVRFAPAQQIFPGHDFVVSDPSPFAQPTRIAAGDFDGDGRPDVVVTVTGGVGAAPGLSLLPGLGGNELGSPAITPLPPDPFGSEFDLAAGDLNGDGIVDAAVGVGESVTIYLGGGGPFTPVVTVHGFQLSADLAIGDIGADGIADVVVNVGSQGEKDVALLVGDGAGGFAEPKWFAAPGGGLTRAKLGDVDGDGLLDLVGAHVSQPEGLMVRLGTPTHHDFAPPVNVFWPGPDQGPEAIALGDFTGDGHLDVVSTQHDFQTAVLLPGDGAGGFGAPAFLPASPGPTTTIAGDLTGDGIADVALIGQESRVYAGVFGATPSLASVFVLSGGPWTAATADFGGDGILDLAVASRTARIVSILPGVGGGSLEVAPTSYVDSGAPSGARIGDLNGDGRIDVVAVGSSTVGPAAPRLGAALGDGAGSFAAMPPVALDSTPTGLALAELDGDGWLDVLATTAGTATEPGRYWVGLGDGAGGFAATSTTFGSSKPRAVAAGDFDGDAHADFAAASSNDEGVTLWLGTGAGTFAAPSVPIQVPGTANSLFAADFDRDGNLDLVAGSPLNGLQVFLGDGNGAFPASGAPTGGYVVAGGVLDANGDGNVDVIARLFVNANLLDLGDGNGGLAPGAPLGFGEAVTLGDLDGDGVPDRVLDAVGSQVNVSRGDGAGGFGAEELHPSDSALDPLLGDVDGDGRGDAVLVSAGPVPPGSVGNVGAVQVFRSQLGTPSSVAPFGAGTSGCSGTLSTNASGVPHLGNASFAVTTANAPPTSLGLGLVADAADLAGSDLFGLGLEVHVDLLASTLLFGVDAASDATGAGRLALPIPSAPALAGATLSAQTLWVEPPSSGLACSAAVLHLVSSKGLSFTLVP